MDKNQFIEYKTATAQDVRDVAGFLNEHADRIQEGDIDSFFELVDGRLELWRQMLFVRMAARQEKYNIGDDEDAIDRN